MYWSPIRIFQLGMLGIYLTPDLTPSHILGHLKVSFQTQLLPTLWLSWTVGECIRNRKNKGSNKSNFIQLSECLKLFLRVIFMQGRACQLRPPQMVKRNVNWLGDLTKFFKNPENQWENHRQTKGFLNSYENQSPTSGKTSFPYGAVVFPLRLGGESITQILHSPSLTWNPKTHGFPVGICYSRGGHFQVPCQPLGGSPNGLGRFCLNFRCHGSASKSTKAKAVYICKTDLYFFSIASNIRFKMMKPKNTSWVLLYFLCLSHVYIVDMHFKWQETRSQSLNCVGSKRPTAIIVAIHLCKGSLGGST